MSWIERLENIEFTITTGDGKLFKPLWKNGEKSKEFNISKYDFIDVEGSLIDRKKAQSNSYPLVFWFQGENNIEQCDDFENSANDNRLWTIQHPFYGTIKGQPTNLKRNDNNYNVTEVTVDFWESIIDEFPNQEISINDEVRSKVTALKGLNIALLVENSSPKTSDIDLVKQNVSILGSKFSADNENFNSFNNTINAAVKSADKIVTDTKGSFEDIQEVILQPAIFENPILSKIKSYIQAYNTIKETITNVFSKFNFEAQSADIFSGICLSCVNPMENDYITRNDIEQVNTLLIDLYNDYLQTLDDNQVDVYDLENNWSPNIQIQTSLIDLVSFTSKSLFSLSFNARQERSFELTSDSNLIILTHRFLGLDANDENIDTFRRINNIKNDELYKIYKGRTIKYFV